jgi:hypothetical protein
MDFACKDGSYVSIKVRSIKSTGDNCLINAMSQCNGELGRGFRANDVRKTLGIPEGPIDYSYCKAIST